MLAEQSIVTKKMATGTFTYNALRTKAYSDSCHLDASSSIIWLVVIYCESPVVQKPAIRTEEAMLTAGERKSNNNNAIFSVRAQRST